MEGMLWGVAAMVVKDAVKQQYVKGRDYERNVRQVYRDVDNLSITVDHVKSNCTAEDMETGPHAVFIKRAEKQLRDSYRTLKREYPRKPGLSRLMEHASKPGAEMHLLDIGKEANQTARGLGDLLSEIRFAKIGKPKEQPPPQQPAREDASQIARRPLSHSMALDENAISDDSLSPHSIPSDQASLFDRTVIAPSSIRSPSSSATGRSKRRPTAPRKRSYSASEQKQKALVPTSFSKSRPLKAILDGGCDREHALDNLQYGIDQVLDACDDEHETEAMEYIQHALNEVLRLQKAQGFAGSRVDEELGAAVEDLDDAMKSLLAAKSEKEKKHTMKKLSHALDDVDAALADRQMYKEQEWEHRLRRITPGSSSKDPSRHPSTHRAGSARREQGSRERRRRYSVY